MRRGAWVLALTIIAATRAGAQQSLRIDGPNQSEATFLLRTAAAGPHDLIVTDSSRRVTFPRGTTLPRTTIIVGGDASVAASVHGDVIVVGGDLFIHPGATIRGKAIAIGGGVYGSTLALVTGGTRSIRDRTFIASRTPDGLRLEYRRLGARDPSIEFPLVEGLRIPSYDRVDGASLAWGPILRPTARLQLDPTVTYRSHLGAWDPGVQVLVNAGEIWRLTIDARRGTFTNDAWINSDLINSITTFSVGSDKRNYYRADRIEATVGRIDRLTIDATTSVELETYAGAMTERAWSVGSPDTIGSSPWTVVGKDDPDHVRRGNPAIEPGRISSAVLGATARWQYGDVRSSATARLEIPWQAPRDERFAQFTTDGTIQFPTFGLQRFRADVHWVITPGDTAPPQRFAYIGGAGTLPVVEDLLSIGGDQLLHLDMRYEVPVPRLAVPYLGGPVLALRHRIGSAGLQTLPRLIQNVGVSATLSFARVEYTIDPASRQGHFSAAFSFTR
ncbi:MAG TPA: hypothetical protein VFW03_12970 [Gemmatimonadaceae bacterium]|nr:hypothetical protein [Gemmatimonadaceae bacterium]